MTPSASSSGWPRAPARIVAPGPSPNRAASGAPADHPPRMVRALLAPRERERIPVCEAGTPERSRQRGGSEEAEDVRERGTRRHRRRRAATATAQANGHAAEAATFARHPPPGTLAEPDRARLLGRAIVFACLSFTPSLLPRTGIIQGIVWGITAAIGYGVGVLPPYLAVFPGPGAAAPAATVLADLLHRRGRADRGLLRARAVLAAPDPRADGGDRIQRRAGGGLPVRRGAVFCLILLIGRGLRGLYHWVARLLRRWIGPRAARAIGWMPGRPTYVVSPACSSMALSTP